MRTFKYILISFFLTPGFALGQNNDSTPCGFFSPASNEMPNLYVTLTHNTRQLRSKEFDCTLNEINSNQIQKPIEWAYYNLAAGNFFVAVEVANSFPYEMDKPVEQQRLRRFLNLVDPENKMRGVGYPKLPSSIEMPEPGSTWRDSALIVITQYLVKYQKPGVTGPLFARFNGGFYNYISTELKWKTDFPIHSINAAIRTLMELAQYDPANPVWYELLGDLMQYHPYRFQGRWFAAMAYFRASLINQETTEGAYRQKAIFALESNRNNPVHYNKKRFARFESSFNKEIAVDEALMVSKDSLAQLLVSSDSLRNGYFSMLPADTTRPLLRQIRADGNLQEEREKPFNPNTDLENKDMKKRVKANVFFNFYAILVILIVAGSVVFFVKQVKKIDRDYHNQP